MIRAVIFDLDGLLIDSETSVWPRAISEFIQSKKLKYTDSLSNKTRGAGHRETVEIFKEDLGLEGNVQELVKEMRSYFFKIFLQNPQLMAGAKDLLENLGKKDYLLSIATGLGPRDGVMKLLSTLKIANYFKVVLTGDEINRGKPNPDIYLLVAKMLEVEPSDCFVLEDAANGVLAGKAAGMEVFGVNKDEEIRKGLANAGANKVFSSLLEIKL